MHVLFDQMHQVKELDCLESRTEDFDSDGESEDEEGGYASDDSEYTGESHDQSDDDFCNEFCDESDV
jgi:hypothetical protein